MSVLDRGWLHGGRRAELPRERGPMQTGGQGVGIVFMDTETGGVSPETDALLEVAFVIWKAGAILGKKRWRVQVEGRPVSEKALKVNRIDLVEHAKVARPRAEVANEIIQYLEILHTEPKYKLRAGGHNVGFDIRFIKALIGDEDWLKHFRLHHVDTASLLTFCRHAELLPPGADMSLRNGLMKAGVEVDPSVAHTALGDAVNTARLYSRLLELIRR